MKVFELYCRVGVCIDYNWVLCWVN